MSDQVTVSVVDDGSAMAVVLHHGNQRSVAFVDYEEAIRLRDACAFHVANMKQHDPTYKDRLVVHHRALAEVAS